MQNIWFWFQTTRLEPWIIDVKMVVLQCPRVAWQSQTTICFPGVNHGVEFWNKNLKKSTYLNELDVRKPLVVSISQRNEKLRFYKLV